MLQTASALSAPVVGAGWYRDPVDRQAARFHDGRGWTKESQPGAGRLMGQHARQSRPRAELTRAELTTRHALTKWTFLGQYADVYL